MMDLDVALTSDEGEFMVLYSDPSNNFAMTATKAKVGMRSLIHNNCLSLYIVVAFQLSADLWLSGDRAVLSRLPAEQRQPLLDLAVHLGSARSGLLDSAGRPCGHAHSHHGRQMHHHTHVCLSILFFELLAGFLVFPAPNKYTSLSVPSLSLSSTTFALMDELPGLFGTTSPVTTTTFAAGASVEVVTAGVQTGWQSAPRAALTTGAVYFTNTLGRLMQSGAFFGREGAGIDGYYYDTASDTIVTAAGRVGYAASADALYVQP